jgi:glutathione S-transferase
MVLEKARAKASPFFVKFIADKIIDGVMDAYFGRNIQQNLLFVEQYLQGKTWLVGEQLSLADFQMSFGLEALYDAGKLDSLANMKAYVERIRETDSHKTAMVKMGLAGG